MVSFMILGAVIAYGQATPTNPLSDTAWVRISLLNQEPDPARAGDTVQLRFKVENAGGLPASNIQFELVQDYPFSIASGQAVRNISDLSPFQTGINYQNIEYIIKIDRDAVQGQRQLQINYRYNQGPWTGVSFSVNIANKQFAQIIFVDKAKLDPGRETDLKFTVTNIGNAPLQNLIFSWQEPTGAILPVYSSDTKYVKYLDVGQSIELAYKVIADVNAKPGLYQLNLNLKSESLVNSSTSLISTKAGIFIGGQTDFEVAFSESSLGQTSLSVANTGNNPAQSVSVKIPQQPFYTVSGSNSAIIGNLDKGDYTIVSFQIVSVAGSNFSRQTGQQARQGQEAPQANQDIAPQRARLLNFSNNLSTAGNLRVVIDYTDTTGERRSIEKLVPIQFRSSTGQASATFGRQAQNTSAFVGSTTFWVIIALAVVLAYFVLKSRKRREKIAGLFGKKR